MDLDSKVEGKLKEKAIFYTEQSRPDWNIPHLNAAIYYMKELIKNEDGDPKILLPAIYLHDIGYAGFLKKGYTFEDNLKAKEEHMIRGAKLSKALLKDLNYFSPEEIDKISKLIEMHDNLNKIRNSEAQLVFEADSLGQVDIKRVRPNFDRENYLKWLADFKKRRVPLFKTRTGLEILKKLLPVAENFFD